MLHLVTTACKLQGLSHIHDQQLLYPQLVVELHRLTSTKACCMLPI